MSSLNPSNMAASVKARLQNISRDEGQTYHQTLQLYAMERFLYRLSRSAHAGTFVLKGALLFLAWETKCQRRTTLDIDLLGFSENSLERLEEITKDVCLVFVVDDGLRFDGDQIATHRIKEDADYEGVRVTLTAFMERTRIPLQIDVGFGDAMVPEPIFVTFPVLLDFPAPELRCYHQLTVVAEKFEAMVKLGKLNSRMKDFFDVWNIIQHEHIAGLDFQKACVATFNQRNTAFDVETDLFQASFGETEDKQKQWAAFLRKQKLMENAPAKFHDVVSQLQSFFLPMIECQLSGKAFSNHWNRSWVE